MSAANMTAETPPRLRLYAHRGAARENPENTLLAFRTALSLGATALETDAHLTADGHVVLAHDDDGQRMCGVPALIRDTTLPDLRRWDAGWGFRDARGERPFAKQGLHIPTLDEVLREFPGVLVNVDLKADSPALVEAFLRLVRRHRAEERVLAASFHARNLRRLRRSFYGGPTALAPSELLALLALPTSVWSKLPFRGQAAQIPRRAGLITLTSPSILRRLHAAQVRVDVWTVNDPEEARALALLGVDGIMTDDPRTIAPVLQEERARPSPPAAR